MAKIKRGPVASFRLSQEAMKILDAIANAYGITRTAAIEIALRAVESDFIPLKRKEDATQEIRG